ncbi:Ulp1-like peptidase [Cucumis melo var. makuwa]|uniref:Ulp1-like peptidase n=1 Tax=Cucumis melo var. makuwa TaxID=1194695 RepID=A0A5D3CCH2_CUCMM|nr:Ulp1-like peptidase [Cucumis melo var. makuwa]TYK09521.1 Ulp1-like peptidase [Cucumis melo var. makuwa]
MFHKTIFGPLLNVNMVFNGQLIHHFLLRKIPEEANANDAHINQSSDPIGYTYQSSDPVGYTYLSSDPEGYTTCGDPVGHRACNTYNGAKAAEYQVSQTTVSKGETSMARLERGDGSDRLRSGVHLEKYRCGGWVLRGRDGRRGNEMIGD